MDAINVVCAQASKEWSDCLQNAQSSMAVLRAACSDVRLTAFASSQESNHSAALTLHDSISFIESPNPQLQQLKEDFNVVNSFTNRIRNASPRSAPIHRLPIEILQLVFSFAVEESENSFDDTLFYTSLNIAIRSTLCLVCHHWFDLCLAVGNLWNNINFHDGFPYTAAKLSIEWSQSLGLFVTLTGSHPSEFRAQADLILPHLNRWSHLIIDYGSLSLVQELFNRPDDIAHCITRVSSNFGGLRRTLDTREARFWSTFNTLRVLEARLAALPWGFAPFQCALSGLTHLRVSEDEIPAEAVRLILQSCPQLLFLELVDVDCEEYEDTRVYQPQIFDGTFVILSALNYLSLRDTSPQTVRQIFSILKAPTLQTLIIDDFALPSLAEVAHFIKESSISLHTLEFCGSLADRDVNTVKGLVTVLGAVPDLRKLCFNGTGMHDRILEALTVRLNSPFCTKLKEIYMKDVRSADLSKLRRMVKSRSVGGFSGVGPLAVLSIIRCTPKQSDASRRDWDLVEIDIRGRVDVVEWDWDSP
jgi:hypothetical protein